MAEYEKVTPAVFRQRLKGGHYASLTGARRAIGRMSAWTDKQRNRAQSDAEKHFESGEAVAKPKKVAKKVSKKKAEKKVADVSASMTENQRPSNKLAKKAAKKTKVRKDVDEGPSVSQTNKVALENLKVGTISQALQSMSVARELGAGETEVAQGAKAAQLALTTIVEDLCSIVTQNQLSEEEQLSLENLAKAAATSAGANGGENRIVPSSPNTFVPTVAVPTTSSASSKT